MRTSDPLQEPLPVQDIGTTPAAGPALPFWQRFDVIVGSVLLLIALSAALTVDPVRNSWGLKGDEASYTALAISLAEDGDIAFERKDLERYWAVYTCGPDGAFLKRGKLARFKLVPKWPFIRFIRWGDAPLEKLYFGKAYIYPLFAAPFFRLFGLNGLLVFHVLLLAGVVWLGYVFLAARSAAPAALTFSLAFVGASIVPVYLVWLTPEIFNLSLVFYAYFLWLYKHVAPPVEHPGRLARFVRGFGSDLVAATLLGMVTFSKPLYILLVGPIIAFQLWGGWRRSEGGRLRLPASLARATALALVFGTVAGGLFTVNAAITGDFSYQGGNRKQVYTWFPHQAPSMTFETVGYANSTNELDKSAVLDPKDLVLRFVRNAGYFVVGRHAGLLPYFFPGLAAVLLWWWRWREIRAWQVLALMAVVATVAVTLAILPFTWSGGGGPPGNRYFLAVYPVLFFLIPPMRTPLVPLLVWAGGAVFTAQLVFNPYFTARYPHVNQSHGAVRLLPVELTMLNDLPIMLDRNRAPVQYDEKADPKLVLYLLDEHAYAPEPAGLWIAGRRRADIVVRTSAPLSHMKLTLSSGIPNKVWLSFDGQSTSLDLQPGTPLDVMVTVAGGVYSQQGYGYMLSVKPEEGMVPKNNDPKTDDKRFLGVLIRMQGTTAGTK